MVFDADFEAQSAFRTADPLIFNSVIKFPASNNYIAYKGYSAFNGPFGEENYKIGFLSESFKLKATALSYHPKLDRALINSPISPFLVLNDTLRFYQNYDPYIYTVSPNGKLKKRYKLAYHPNPLPEKYEETVLLPGLDLLNAKDHTYEDTKKVFKGYAGFGGQWYESNQTIKYYFRHLMKPMTNSPHSMVSRTKSACYRQIFSRKN